MAEVAARSNGGIDYLEKDLTCSICTDIVYQPLTLLDCLHSFCGACLKEWFSWQAASAVQQRRRANRPYTCPSCREPVRTTKADWRLTTLLEDYLARHPDRAKSLEEKEEIQSHYKPGDDVLPPLPTAVDEDDSEDERLLAQVRDMSMEDVDAHGTRPRNGRSPRHRRVADPNRSHGNQQQSRLTEARMREHDAEGPHIGHQPSLRSLLSVSDADPQEVQAEILQSIYSEGLLDGIDIDNLSPEQEEELTERIAEAYRRRRRQRDSSRGSGQRSRERGQHQSAPQSDLTDTMGLAQNETSSPPVSRGQTPQSRARQPISRPHVFEQSTTQTSLRNQVRSSSNDQRIRSTSQETSSTAYPPTARSATDLSQQPRTDETQNETSNRPPTASRSTTDPVSGAERLNYSSSRPNSSSSRGGQPQDQRPPSSRDVTTHPSHQVNGESGTISSAFPGALASPPAQRNVHPAVSRSSFAPEPVSSPKLVGPVPFVKCHHCNRSDIQYELYYNCATCNKGLFNLCLRCYREGRGCQHWFGFGYRAFERWNRSTQHEAPFKTSERPHVLTARRYVQPSSSSSSSPQSYNNAVPNSSTNLEEGAFCERCLAFTNASYWYCSICLDGAWGFCEACVKRGQHCTHQLLPVGHASTQTQSYQDVNTMIPIPLPNLPEQRLQGPYVALPVPTFCDVCHRPISPSRSRYHCYACNHGDYDVCEPCYSSLEAQGKISAADGAEGWRRCLHGHRMAVIVYESTTEGAHLRTTLREPVGGRTLKDDGISSPPSGADDRSAKSRCLALYNYFPADGVQDELSFPKNGEIREVSKVHEEWYFGTYAGATGLFPSNHVKML